MSVTTRYHARRTLLGRKFRDKRHLVGCFCAPSREKRLLVLPKVTATSLPFSQKREMNMQDTYSTALIYVLGI